MIAQRARNRFGLAMMAGGALACSAALSGSVQADEIYGTGEPCTGFFGCIGFDVFTQQTVGLRFTPTSDYTLDSVSMWFMSNRFDAPLTLPVEVTIQTDLNDNGCSHPSGVILDTMSFVPTAVGWDPRLDTVVPTTEVELLAGENYWVVCKSDSPPGDNPVWNIVEGFTSFAASTQFDQTTWQCGGEGAAIGIFIEGTRTGSDYVLDVPALNGGQNATLSITGGTPNAAAYIAYSTSGPGQTFVGPLNVTVELSNPVQGAAPITTDAQGDGQWQVTVPPAATGRTVWIQSIQFNKRSNLVQTTVG